MKRERQRRGVDSGEESGERCTVVRLIYPANRREMPLGLEPFDKLRAVSKVKPLVAERLDKPDLWWDNYRALTPFWSSAGFASYRTPEPARFRLDRESEYT